MTDPFQLFAPLSTEEFDALKASIAEHGVQVAVEVDQHGVVLDGHHRVRAFNELKAEGVVVPDYKREVRIFASDEERLDHAIGLNVARRQLTPAARSSLIERASLARMEPTADRCGDGHSSLHHPARLCRWPIWAT